ncbi:MAG: hypothetical protein KF803_12465 [Cyclobacteriaceae bacterium]|nr:hypothetical protein [Cyclobacteriaceae bacterium]
MDEPVKAGEVFETPYVTMWLKDGLVYCKYADDLDLSIEVAKFCVESRIFFTKGKPAVLLVDMKGIKSTSKEARNYMATIGTTLVTAAALVTGSPFNNALANLFLSVNKPAIPTRLFSNEDDARQWLLPYLEQ